VRGKVGEEWRARKLEVWARNGRADLQGGPLFEMEGAVILETSCFSIQRVDSRASAHVYHHMTLLILTSAIFKTLMITRVAIGLCNLRLF